MIEEKVFSIGDHMITIKSRTELIDVIDVDDALKIDYANILGELLTFPVLLNQLGELLAEVEDAERAKMLEVDNKKEDLDALKGNLEFEAFADIKKGNPEINRAAVNSPTAPMMKAWVLNDQRYLAFQLEYRNIKMELIGIQRDKGHIKNLYWTAKAKQDVLTKMTDKLSPSEFSGELMDGTINGIMLKIREKLIKDPKV